MRGAFWVIWFFALVFALASTPACALMRTSTEIETEVDANLSRLYEAVIMPTVRVGIEGMLGLRFGRGGGTGVIAAQVDNHYYVLTCYHVIDYSDLREFTLTDMYIEHIQAGRLPVRIFKTYPAYDLALLVFEYDGDLPVITFANKRPALLSHVYSCGWLPFDPAPVVKDGFLCNYKHGSRTLPQAWSVSANVWFGYSGGGVFNDRGEFIGTMARIYASNAGPIPWHAGIVPFTVSWLWVAEVLGF